MLTMAKKITVGLAIVFFIILVGVAVIPASSYEVNLTTSPNKETIFIPAGKPFNITCKGLGDDARKFSSFKWLNKEGQVISEGISGTKEEAKNLLTLTFKNPKKDQSGVYKCVAVYEKKYTLQKSVSIIVQGSVPSFKETSVTVTATENSLLEMLCAAEGELPITYEWYDQDDKRITGSSTSSSIYVSNKENNTSVLVLRTVSMNHRGTYTCRAINSHGSLSKTFELTVLKKDNELASFQSAKVINVTSTSVKFDLTITGPAKTITVKYGESRSSNGSIQKEFKYGDAYEIKDLIPAGLYNFMFKTSPSKEDWSRPYRVVLLPSKPEVIFRQIDSGTIKLEWLFKFDDRMRKTIDRHELSYVVVQMESGIRWKPGTCPITILLPECTSSFYTISGLSQNVYYEIQLKAHTASGYGEAYSQKIFMPNRF